MMRRDIGILALAALSHVASLRAGSPEPVRRSDVAGAVLLPGPAPAQESCESQRATFQALVGQVAVSREQTEIELARTRVRLQGALADVGRLHAEVQALKAKLPAVQKDEAK
jgi:hypothetical protein